jgi:hypothetical protein
MIQAYKLQPLGNHNTDGLIFKELPNEFTVKMFFKEGKSSTFPSSKVLARMIFPHRFCLLLNVSKLEGFPVIFFFFLTILNLLESTWIASLSKSFTELERNDLSEKFITSTIFFILI